MAGWGPTTLASADWPVAQKPTFGGEMDVYLTRDPAIEIGKYAVKATNSGVYTADPVNTPLTGSGSASELIAVVDTSAGMYGGASNIVLTVTGTDQTDAALTGTATFAVPAWVKNTQRVFCLGFATDVVPATAGKKFKTVTGVTSTNATDAKNSAIALFSVQSYDNFVQVGCTTTKEFTTKARVTRPVACGMDASAFAKPGRSDPGELNITSKAVTYGDGLAKFNGINCTAMLKVVKEGQIETDRWFFIGYRPTVRPNFGDGEDEATFQGTGFYEDLAVLVAG